MQAQEAVQNHNGVEHTPPAPTQENEAAGEQAQATSTPPAPEANAQPAANSYLSQLQQRRQSVGRNLETLRAQRQLVQEQMEGLEAQMADIEINVRRTEGAALVLEQMIQEEKQAA